ncbi:MAG: GTP-binding protein [Candidatus Thorarchaeota archaeon]|nr:GTP-binding protein [Candidatus Thorarchaeota archaeon]
MSPAVVKVAMVGSGGAGKTTIASRLVTGQFVETMMTIGVSIQTWSIESEAHDSKVVACVFDLGGQQQFRFFQSSLLIGTQVVLIVVDLTRFSSLMEVDNWIPMILHVPRERWIIVANKADEECGVKEEDIREKAQELGVPYVIVSAKTGQGFDALAAMATKIILSSVDQ